MKESTLAAYREDPRLFVLAWGAAATSIAALLLHLLGVIRMPYTLSFVTLPGMTFLVCLLVLAGKADRPIITGRLRSGLAAGLLGLLAYNGTRWVLGAVLGLGSGPFYSISIFGSLITGKPLGSPVGDIAGWAYHLSNGVTFAIMYTLVAGPARWWFGLLWGAALEVAMLLIYPSSSILRPPALAPFVVVSLTSHAVFGTVIGLVSRVRSPTRPGVRS
ncbi:hypothetical protein [Amycolatopsis vastitatis]|uniref:Uncharacterized protein n=1 Tax=Amycolatopsis vastitatis TaxID=1905142 RepID=A0A229SXB2_9PSEU|nr:hypothetical protein [Amycolatopsis vastitatis]OXM63294.1 hypothetical protein CF165_30825 [Amycolatopsis vastitatis]